MSPFDVLILECDDFSYEFCNDDIRKSIWFLLFYLLLIETEAIRFVEWFEVISRQNYLSIWIETNHQNRTSALINQFQSNYFR